MPKLPPGIISEDHDPVQGTTLSKRAGSHRRIVSPKLLVDYLMNDGVFYHNGKRYIDTSHQSKSVNFHRRALSYGLSNIAKYAPKPLLGRAAPLWEEQDYYSFSPDFEFKLSDVVSPHESRQ